MSEKLRAERNRTLTILEDEIQQLGEKLFPKQKE